MTKETKEQIKELKTENKMLKKQLQRYRGTLRIPLCEICGELIYGNETRIVLKKLIKTPQYQESVMEHIHIKCWDKIKKEFKYKIGNLK